MKKIESIQALRAFAAAFIFLYHSGAIGDKGYFGVEIFFVISGFLACYTTESGRYEHFLGKKLIRIVPLYWLATLAMYALIMLRPSLSVMSETGLSYLIRSLCFIPFRNSLGSDAPILGLGWTLNYEMFFYLVFWTAFHISRKHRDVICAGILGGLTLIGRVLVLTGVLGASEGVLFFMNYYTNPILMEFVYGICVFEVMRGIQPSGVSGQAGGVARQMLLVACSISFAWLLAYRGGTDLRFLTLGIPAAIAVATFLKLTVHKQFPAWMIRMGDYSYTFFLAEYFTTAAYKLAAPKTPGMMRYLLLVVIFAMTCSVSSVVEIYVSRFTKKCSRLFF